MSVFEWVSLVLFLSFFSLISKVNFMQNDDWNRTTSVVKFLSGDFSLLPRTATTFYVQGLLGFVFSLIFGWKNLPFLTLALSVLNFYIFAKILHDYFSLGKIKSILISLLLFFTPLHMYSAIGFMTENYTMFFMLLAIYFFLKYEKDSKLSDFHLFNISGLLAFFTKQNGIIFNVAAIFYFLFKKRFKEALAQTAFVIAVIGYYFLLFPRTEEMRSKGFIIENFSDPKYAYSLMYGILLVTVSFVLPFIVYFVSSTIFSRKKIFLKTLFIFGFAALLFFFLNKYFSPGKISWEEYPYFENTFERTGFFPRSILGTKYHFKWNYDIYRYWDLSSKILLAFLLPCLIFYRKKIVNIYSISILGYLVLMVFTKIFYDRYILSLVPLSILFILHLKPVEERLKNVFLITLVPFVVFSSILSVQMATDFIISNNYVWSRSENLVEEGISPNKVRATMAWSQVYKTLGEPDFFFSFSSPETEPDYLIDHNFFEEKGLGFKGSIFVDPAVYLYKRK